MSVPVRNFAITMKRTQGGNSVSCFGLEDCYSPSFESGRVRVEVACLLT